jgi:MFS family permease
MKNGSKKNRFHYGHAIAAACFGIQAIGIGCYTSYGVFFNPMVSEFGWSRAGISGAASMALLFMGFFGVLVGRLNDRIGPRKMMTIGGFFIGLGYSLMSRLGSVWELYLFYGVIFGIGLSSVDVIPLSTTARWFVRKRGMMTGIVKVGTGTGQFLLPLAASLFIAHYGWRNAYLIMGASVFLLLVSAAQVLRRDPGRMGLLPDGDKVSPVNKSIAYDQGLSLGEVLRTSQFWMICAANLSIVFCLMLIVVHIVPHAQDIGISPAIAAGTLSLMGGASMASRFLTGMVLDRIGSRRALMICFILFIAGLLWLQRAGELWMFTLFALVNGFAHGGFYTVVSPIIAEFFGMRAHGVLFGLVAFSGALGGAVGPILAGYIFDVTGGYGPAFWFCVLMSAAGLLLVLLLKPIKGTRS